MIKNPILPGFNPDPCICRKDDDYYIAVQRAGYENLLLEDVFIHHFGSVSFKKLENAEYRKIFDANRSYFENKWDVKWKMHHYRPDVAASISNT